MTQFKRKKIVVGLLPLIFLSMKTLICRVARHALLASLLSIGLSSQAAQSSPASQVKGSKAPAVEYVLQPQDQIRVNVFQEEDINKQCEMLSVAGDYTVTLPLLGTVNLRNKTQRQAETLIRELYDKDYIINPTVTVTVTKYADRSVNVTGHVTTAGRIQFPPERGLTITDAISLAGGQTRLADLKRVKLTRRKANGEAEALEVNVDAIVNNGASNVVLEVGDTINVPERRI